MVIEVLAESYLVWIVGTILQIPLHLGDIYEWPYTRRPMTKFVPGPLRYQVQLVNHGGYDNGEMINDSVDRPWFVDNHDTVLTPSLLPCDPR